MIQIYETELLRLKIGNRPKRKRSIGWLNFACS